MSHNVANLGQVFTPPAVVTAMLQLRRRTGRALEPSAGDGAFSRHLPDCIAIEADPRHAPPGAIVSDFFAYPECERFATVIGNPPYVRYQDIRPQTSELLRSALFDGRSNLYLFFIEKAVRHLEPGGELIFITPRDFLKSTSAVKLNRWLCAQGSITDAIELGDAKVFEGAVPNCLIWRFELGAVSRETHYAEIGWEHNLAAELAAPRWETRHLIEADGHLMFARQPYTRRLGDYFSVRVGAVSGADAVFRGVAGNRDFVCSSTARTRQTVRMLYQAPGAPNPAPALLPHKATLLARRIRHYNENNWWQWGRGYPETDAPRIYVNQKTRQAAPFFLHDCPHFDGAVLALFPHRRDVDLEVLSATLNAVDWRELGFVCDGRFLFTQRSLENSPLPDTVAALFGGAV